MAGKVRLVVSIDTEEDNWVPARSGISVDNIRELVPLAKFFDRLGVRATYFTGYQVASRPWAAEILGEITASGAAEIGAHLHPWNTPPYDGPDPSHASMLLHYPFAVQRSKLESLTEVIEAHIGTRPVSFRAGRFGLGPATLGALVACGYRVDSSVTPYMDWSDTDGGPDFSGAPISVYRLDPNGDVRDPAPDGPVVEVPISVGYTRFRPDRWPEWMRRVGAPAARRVHLAGIAARTGFIRRVILSPETNGTRDLLALSRRLLEGGVGHLHLFFHSSSLRPGLTPFARSRRDVDRIYHRIERLIDRLAAVADLSFGTVREAAAEAEDPQGMSVPPDSVRPAKHEAAARVTAPARKPQTPGPVSPGTHRRATASPRLLVISHHFPPDGSVGGLRWGGLSRYLAHLGWEVHVLTAATGAVPGLMEGIHIHRSPRVTTVNDLYNMVARRLRRSRPAQPRSPSAGAAAAPSRPGVLGAIRAELSALLAFPDHGRGRILGTAIRARMLMRRYRPTVVVTSGPPHSVHVAGRLAVAGSSTPLVADMRDPWAGLIPKSWAQPIYATRTARSLTPWLERRTLRAAAAVITNTREFAATLSPAYPSLQVRFVPNGIDPDRLPAPSETRLAGLSAAYVGTLYAGRDLGPVLRAFGRFLERHPAAAAAGSKLRAAGSMTASHAARLRGQIEAQRLAGHVELLGVVPAGDALDLLNRSHVAIVLAQDQELQVPAKLYECVGLHLPTLVIAEADSAAAREAARIGAIVKHADDVAGICDVFERLWTGKLPDRIEPREPIDYLRLAEKMDGILAEVGGVAPAHTETH